MTSRNRLISHLNQTPPDRMMYREIDGLEYLVERITADLKVPVKVQRHAPSARYTSFLVAMSYKVHKDDWVQTKPSDVIKKAEEIAIGIGVHEVLITRSRNFAGNLVISVPNRKLFPVTMMELINEYDSDHSVPVFLGRSPADSVMTLDLAKVGRLLVAGASGSGKSVFLDSLLISTLIYAPTTSVIIIDVKKVSFLNYRGISNLRKPIITDAEEAVEEIQSVVQVMDYRYDQLAQAGCKDIDAYNRKFPDNPMPRILLLIDEVADLMIQSKNEMEQSLIRLSQLSRASGIMMVLATQKPTREFVPTAVRANITDRVCFATSTLNESLTALDQKGAEMLNGRGDLLYMSGEVNYLQRAQSPMVTDEEIMGVCQQLK